MKTFETLREAKKEYKKQTGVEYGTPTLNPIKIFNRRRAKWRTPAQRKRITRPYVVCTYLEYINYE